MTARKDVINISIYCVPSPSTVAADTIDRKGMKNKQKLQTTDDDQLILSGAASIHSGDTNSDYFLFYVASPSRIGEVRRSMPETNKDIIEMSDITLFWQLLLGSSILDEPKLHNKITD